MKTTIFKISLLSICIFTFASCSLSKNVSNKDSCEKLRLLQQDETPVREEVIITPTMNADINAETPEPKFASRVISPAYKSKALVANKLSFHRVRNASINILNDVSSPESSQSISKIKKDGTISDISFILSILSTILFFIPVLSTMLLFSAFILGIIAIGLGSKNKGLAIAGILIGILLIFLLDILTGPGFLASANFSGFNPW